MEKGKKQEVTNRKLNFGNISKADMTFKNEKVKETSDNLVPIKFKVHKDLLEKFQILKIDYAKANKKFSLSNNDMFSIGVKFIENILKEKKILIECPEDFKKSIIKPGKRKATERTFPSDQTDSILFTIPESIADDYMNIMFSHITNDPDDSIFNSHHSRTYFFYDFMNYLKSNKADLLKFKYE